MGKITLRRATDDDFSAMTDFDGASFGEPWPAEELELLRPTLDLDRFILAHDGETLVGLDKVLFKAKGVFAFNKL